LSSLLLLLRYRSTSSLKDVDMKRVIKLLTVILSLSSMVMLSTNANAHGGYEYGHRGWHGDGWVGPAIIGGLITYSILQPRPVYVAQPPVYIQTAPMPAMASVPPAPVLAQNLPPVWYYCASRQTYYPYTKNCSEGWQVVPASPQ
jgi:hypothetical protein